MGVSREGIEEVLKSLSIGVKLLVRRSNAMCDILLVPEESRSLTGSIITTKMVGVQTEHIGTQRTKVTLHWMPMDVEEDHVGAFFTKYGQVEVLSVALPLGISRFC